MIRRFERVEGAPAIPIAALSATAIAKCEHFPFDTFVGSRGAEIRKGKHPAASPSLDFGVSAGFRVLPIRPEAYLGAKGRVNS